jgi:CheY-like chemotaxis protein
MFREVLVRLFTAGGHEVECVSDGKEAWNRISSDLRHFDVLVTDYRMSGLDGLELVELLQQAGYPGKIIVHTASLTEEEREKFLGFGVSQIVIKKAEAEGLLAIVEALHEI